MDLVYGTGGLPVDVWLEVFKFANGQALYKDLALVCKLWGYIVYRMDSVWEEACSNEFGIDPKQIVLKAPSDFCWREYYISKTLFSSSTPTWKTVTGDSSQARSSHTCTTVGDKIFIIGSESDTVSMCTYNHETMSTTDLHRGVIYEKLSRHSAVLYKKQIYIFGGMNIDTGIKYNDVFALHTETFETQLIETTGVDVSARADHDACVVGNLMLVFWGSSANKKPLSDINALNLDNHEWELYETRGFKPLPRSGHSVAVIGEKVFVFGGGQWFGVLPSWDTKFNDLHVLDTATREWMNIKCGGMLPRVSVYTTLFVIEQFLFVVSGSSHECTLTTSEFHVLDTVTMEWKDLHGTFFARDSSAIGFYNNTPLMMYGNSASSHIEQLDMPWRDVLDKYRHHYREVQVIFDSLT